MTEFTPRFDSIPFVFHTLLPAYRQDNQDSLIGVNGLEFNQTLISFLRARP